MGYSILSSLFAWTMPIKKDRQDFRKVCKRADNRNVTKIIKKRYEKIVAKLRAKSKIKVLFLVNENSKWKAQSLYDLMQTTTDFEPIIGLTIADIQKKLPVSEKEIIIKQNQDFFEKKGMQVVVTYDCKNDRAIDLKNFDADVVFYQQPYSIPKIQDIEIVSKFALTCYIPYYLPDYRNFDLDCDKDFHHNLFRFYVLDDELKNIYKKHLAQESIDTENIKGLGHTALDVFRKSNEVVENKAWVIYAPHWSVAHENNLNNINISTFDMNGQLILDFAKKHPEIKWLFKPHPTLKTALLKIGEMTEAEIDNYYAEWEKIAKCCYDGSYVDYFKESDAMITDCGSFLLEYFCTGKPLIHLISQNCENVPYPQMQAVFNTFYQVRSNTDLLEILDSVILTKNDYKKEIRNKVVDQYALTTNFAALNIINDLKTIMKRSAKQ